MSGRDRDLASVFSHIGNTNNADNERDLIFTTGDEDEEEVKPKRNNKTRNNKNPNQVNPITVLNKIVAYANKKPSLKKDLTAKKIKDEARLLFIRYLNEYYSPSFDESKL